MARKKLLSGGLVQAGVKDPAKRKRIKARIIAGGKGGLKAAGVKKRGDRRIIRENVTVAAATRSKRAAKDRRARRAAERPKTFVRGLINNRPGTGR